MWGGGGVGGWVGVSRCNVASPPLHRSFAFAVLGGAAASRSGYLQVGAGTEGFRASKSLKCSFTLL